MRLIDQEGFRQAKFKTRFKRFIRIHQEPWLGAKMREKSLAQRLGGVGWGGVGLREQRWPRLRKQFRALVGRTAGRSGEEAGATCTGSLVSPLIIQANPVSQHFQCL